MKSLTKREIVIGAGVSPSSPDFYQKCQNYVCSQLCFNSKTLNLKLKAFVSKVKNFYRNEGLYLSVKKLFDFTKIIKIQSVEMKNLLIPKRFSSN